MAPDSVTNAVYIKDERYGPTSSFKDRQAAVAVAAMLEAGIHEAVIASTGNAAVAYAAACARAGIKLWVFMTSLVPQEKLREAALFGAEVIRVSGNYDQTKQIAAEFAERRHLLLDRGASSIPARESMKTIAYEIVEQLGWRAPDWYIQSVSGGLGPLGVFQGFQELQRMGLIDRVPKLAVIQAEGCAPMVRAFKAGKDTAEAVIPDTRIIILSTGDPGKSYTYLWKLVSQFGGTMESVTDAEAFASMRSLAKTEGMAVEPAAAVAFAGLEKLVTKGRIGRTRRWSSTAPATPSRSKNTSWESSSLSMSSCATARRPPRAKACRRRSRTWTNGPPPSCWWTTTRTTPCSSGACWRAARPTASSTPRTAGKGLAQARQRRPDLIVADLMMPGLDGFGLVEELRRDPRTREIPIVVVSAKDITPEERQRLNGHIEAVYQKGSLPPRKFVEQVIQVIEEKNQEKEGSDMDKKHPLH